MSYLLILFSLFMVYFMAKCVSFARNYAAAVRTGYPIFVSPIPTQTIVWQILGPACNKSFEKWLPRWIFDQIDVVTHGWEFRLKSSVQAKLGKTFCVVTPDECTLWVADPALCSTILLRRKDFMQAPITEVIIGILGSNIVCANGEKWQRQRRIVAPNLSERISKAVWQESCRQATSMLDYLVKNPGDETITGLKTIAINILGHVGYGNPMEWTPDSESKTSNIKKEDLNYFNTISLITLNLMESAFLPQWFLKLPFMPKYLQTLGSALEQMPHYTKELLDSERRAAKEDSKERNYFLSMLVRFSDAEGSESGKELALTDDEISGNLFAVSAAGFDTTANTMGYAAILLAAYPQWQDWIAEELETLPRDPATWDYDETFPKLQRVLALMYETLRFFTPVLHSTRYTAAPQQVTDRHGVHQLPASMMVYVSSQSIHFDKDIYGADVNDFKPSRWLDLDGKLITPPKGTFLPWSGGPRVCPGMKMSQVEFVAVFATLFRSSRCETLLAGQETPKQARERLERIMADSIPKLTMQTRDPKEVKLKWISTG